MQLDLTDAQAAAVAKSLRISQRSIRKHLMESAEINPALVRQLRSLEQVAQAIDSHLKDAADKAKPQRVPTSEIVRAHLVEHGVCTTPEVIAAVSERGEREVREALREVAHVHYIGAHGIKHWSLA